MKRLDYLLSIISLLIILFLYSPVLQAQQPIFKTKKENLQYLLEAGRRTENSNPDSSILYTLEALKYAKNLNITADIAVIARTKL